MPTAITALSPARSHHGVPLTISGTGLSSTVRVNFGARGVPPTGVTDTAVTCMIPELPAGQYNVSVTTASITSNSLPFYYIGPPKLTALNPAAGPLTAAPLTLFGENLHTTTSVTFGGVGAATSVITVSNNVLTVVAPEHPPLPPGVCTDTVDVQVTTAGGTSPLSDSRGQYTFCAAPVVTDMRPSSASVTSEFTLGGTCLQGATRVTFAPTAGGPATQADYHALSSSSLLVIVAPHLSEGTYDVQVTGPGGRSPLGPRTVFTV